ncbi:MAG: GNAT family N-acetyltransferase [Pseudomonadota bacterium]
MSIPDLPPDLTFPRLGSTSKDKDVAFDVKRAAMGPHILKRWGWDEEFQRNIHEQRFKEKSFFKIQFKKQALGTFSFDVLEDHIRFGEFYIYPEFQGQGIGSKILKHCLRQAELNSLPVRLEYLKWSPVGSLYKRHGFVEVGQSEYHYHLELSIN